MIGEPDPRSMAASLARLHAAKANFSRANDALIDAKHRLLRASEALVTAQADVDAWLCKINAAIAEAKQARAAKALAELAAIEAQASERRSTHQTESQKNAQP